jgi:hypothetical protein
VPVLRRAVAGGLRPQAVRRRRAVRLDGTPPVAPRRRRSTSPGPASGPPSGGPGGPGPGAPPPGQRPAPAPSGGGGGNRTVLIIVGAVVALLIIVGVVLAATGAFSSSSSSKPKPPPLTIPSTAATTPPRRRRPRRRRDEHRPTAATAAYIIQFDRSAATRSSWPRLNRQGATEPVQDIITAFKRLKTLYGRRRRGSTRNARRDPQRVTDLHGDPARVVAGVT